MMASPVSSPKAFLPPPEEALPPPPTYTREAANPYEQYTAPPPFPSAYNDLKHAVVEEIEGEEEEQQQPLLQTPALTRQGWRLNILGFWLSCGIGATLGLWLSSGFPVSYCDPGLTAPRPEMPVRQPPKLTIHGAAYADRDITAQMQELVNPDQTLFLDPIDMNGIVGDPWYGTVKSVVILYQYEGREMEMLISHEWDGMFGIDHRWPVDVRKVEILKQAGAQSTDSIIATVWGIDDAFKGLDGKFKKADMQSLPWIPCTNGYFGFDGFPNVQKSCVVFVRGRDGGIKVCTGREGRKVRLPVRAERFGG